MLLSAEHISINFGSRQLLEDVNFYLNEGDKTGIIQHSNRCPLLYHICLTSADKLRIRNLSPDPRKVHGDV